MEKTVSIKYLRISPKKLRMIMEFYKGKNAEKLLSALAVQPKRGAEIIAKALKAGLQMFTDTEKKEVKVKAIAADQGPMFKRWMPGSRGMAKKYAKKTSHLSITLAVPSEKKVVKNG